jgi:hypothetical protein
VRREQPHQPVTARSHSGLLFPLSLAPDPATIRRNYANSSAIGFLSKRQVFALSVGYNPLSSPALFGSIDTR